MELKFKNTFWGYFNFYYSVLGNKLVFNLFLAVIVSFLDGLGLAMFMPLLQVSAGDKSTNTDSLGNFHYVVDFVKFLGFDLTIVVVLFILVLLFVVKGGIKFIQLRSQVNLRHIFIRKIRMDLITNLQNLSFSGFVRLDYGRLQNTMTTEVQRLFQTMNFYFSTAQASVMLGAYMVLAFFANFQFAFLVVIGAGLSTLIYRHIYSSTKAISVGLSKHGNEFNGFLIQAIHYFKYLKATNSFGIYSKNLKKVVKKTETLNKKMGFYTAVTTSVKEPVTVIVVALVIYFQVNYLRGNLTGILLSLLLFYRALALLMVVQNYWQNFTMNIGAMNAISLLYGEMSDMKEVTRPHQHLFEKLTTEIHLNNITFSYGASPFIENINIHIQKNKTIAFIGESGSGKSTLVNLISGLITPDDGNILVDGSHLGDLDINSYRSKIGYVSQEPVIFNDDVFNNITFWAERTSTNIAKFWEVTDLTNLRSFIESQPDKENTQLGDNGMFISGGQKQRISIARELYKDVEVLILDEATSALDSETEHNIQINIDSLHGAYTMIIIAHRLSTIKNADTIYLLDKGKISASGSLEQMLEWSERFKRMVSLQDMH